MTVAGWIIVGAIGWAVGLGILMCFAVIAGHADDGAYDGSEPVPPADPEPLPDAVRKT